MTCPCGAPARPGGRFCCTDHYQRAYRLAHPYRVQAWRRAEQRKAQARRPRCVVCFAPIRYGANGVRHDSRTCGRRSCALTAWRWFGPMKPRRVAA